MKLVWGLLGGLLLTATVLVGGDSRHHYTFERDDYGVLRLYYTPK